MYHRVFNLQQQCQLDHKYIVLGDAYCQLKFCYYFRALSKLVAKKPENWDEYLDAVMFGLRTKTQITTKFSPFFLMFGREARYPTEVPEDFMVGKHIIVTINFKVDRCSVENID